MAEQDTALRPVLEGQANFTRTFWMSMPAETKHLVRMQAVWNFLRETAQAQQSTLLPPHAGRPEAKDGTPPRAGRPALPRKQAP